MSGQTGVRVAGCNLGKASCSFVIGSVGPDGRLALGEPEYVLHEGKPFELFRRWYREQEVAGCAALGATGVYAAELGTPALRLPEDACQGAALARAEALPDVLNLVSLGARGYGVLSRKPAPVSPGLPGPAGFQLQFLENDKCSSGTGENMQRMASRFGLTLAQADELARTATGSVAITARCSVFAKSELTHHANQGKPIANLLAGYFDSVARNTHALLSRNQVDGPVYLIGGGARIESFRSALEALVGARVQLLEQFLAFEAVGAAALAAEQHALVEQALPEDPERLVRERKARFRVLAPASGFRDRVTLLPAPRPQEAGCGPVVLGLDLGSTGAKLVLTSVATGEPVLDLYDETRGNPVDATRRLIRSLEERGRFDVRGIGVTGSGREAVATLLEAVFGGLSRIVVLNEIVAHATAAIRCDPEGGRDLSVIEIGGQDAKYIRISEGRIVESDLNKACSAGTGSFLQEQAQFYDVHDIGQFVALAEGATRPAELGQMCTVYVADAGVEALKDGFELGDVFAGFQYSIVQNYLNRVMGQRTLAKRIFFQGKPASNASLAWTLASVTGCDITVPPNPGAMGAWGVGLCALRALEKAGAEAPAFELGAILRAEITGRSEFQCKDARCRTMCPIERTAIRVGAAEHVAVSGGACPKFELATKRSRKLPVDAPNPFEERARLIRAYARLVPGRRVVAIPLTGALVGYLPWFATLIAELGFSVRILESDATSLARGEQLCQSFDSCSPTKIAHALCEAEADWLLFPKILDFGDACGTGGQTCVTEQAMPEMVEQSAKARGRHLRLLRPTLSFAGGTSGPAIEWSLAALAASLGASPARLVVAIARATAAQERFTAELLELGRAAIDYADQHGLPVVPVCGALHVIHDDAVNATVPRLLRQNGAVPVPADCFPLPAGAPAMKKIYWGDPNRYLRVAAAARESRRAFPLMLSSFGCGPASFTEQFFESLTVGYPHTILESDGHGGTAGFVTRIQAFLHSVEQFRAEPESRALPGNARALAAVEPGVKRGPYLDRDVRYVFLSSVEYLGALFAAIYRSSGYDAVAAAPLSAENFERGRRDCSGKECLSYQLVWGAFREHLEQFPPLPDRETRLVQISGQMCRAGVFGVKDTITLDQLGLGKRVTVTALKMAGGAAMSARLFAGLTVLDLIRQLYLYHLAGEVQTGQLETTYRALSDEVIELLGRPYRGGWRTPARLGSELATLRRLVQRACELFPTMADGARTRTAPTVFVSGDLMTKGSDFANSGLYAAFARRGVRLVVEPACDFLEYLALVHPHLIFGQHATASTVSSYTASMRVIRHQFYDLARARHAWLPMPDVDGALRAAARVIDLRTNGGGALSVGSTLHHWESGSYDGVVLTACWGCDNGLIAESLLRHRRDMPTYFFYDDATPLDERRLDSFAFRLRARKREARG